MGSSRMAVLSPTVRPIGRTRQQIGARTHSAPNCRDPRNSLLERQGSGGPSGLQNRQARVAHGLEGSIPSPLRMFNRASCSTVGQPRAAAGADELNACVSWASSPLCVGCEGSSASATTAPAAATPAATELAAWKPSKKAELAALWMAVPSAGWPASSALPATVYAAPTDACALRAAPAGNPAGRALVRRLA